MALVVVLAVPGSAVQVAVAREIALGRLGEGERLGGAAYSAAARAGFAEALGPPQASGGRGGVRRALGAAEGRAATMRKQLGRGAGRAEGLRRPGAAKGLRLAFLWPPGGLSLPLGGDPPWRSASPRITSRAPSRAATWARSVAGRRQSRRSRRPRRCGGWGVTTRPTHYPEQPRTTEHLKQPNHPLTFP